MSGPASNHFISRHRLQLAANAVRKGGIIAYPTEAVWGLGCDPNNADAVGALLALKQRPDYKGLILVASRWQQLIPYVDVMLIQQRYSAELANAQAHWPGPVTWIMPARAPTWLTGGRDTVAVRVSAHAGVSALCDTMGGALVSTSANLSGKAAACSQLELQRRVDYQQLAYVLQGDTAGLERPTAIYDMLTGKCLRA